MDDREELLKALCDQWKIINKKYPEYSTDTIIEQFMSYGHNTKLLCYLMEQILYGALDNDWSQTYKVKILDIVTEKNKDLNERIRILKNYLLLFSLDEYQEDKRAIEASFAEFSKRIKSKFSLENCDKLKAMKGYIRFLNGAELHQFQKGKATNTKPYFATTILVFESMDLAVRYVKDIPGNVIALVGIKPNERIKKEFLESDFFAYLIKNGENIYVFADTYRERNSYYPSITGHRDVGRDELMPYVELGSFQYVWTLEIFGVKIADLNTDKYYIVPYGRQWNKWQLSELVEAEQVLLQYFMFNYLQNRFFIENAPDLELSYTQSQLVLTVHDMPVNQHYYPVELSQNTTTVALPVADRDTMNQLGLYHSTDLIPFSASDGTLVDIYGNKIEDIEENVPGYACDPYRLRGFSSMCFGTPQQIDDYLKRLEKFNAERLVDRQKRKQKKIDEECLTRFYTYLTSEKFKNLLIRKSIQIALDKEIQSNKRNQYPTFWLEDRKQIKNYYCGFWSKDHNCILSGKKGSYRMMMEIRSVEQIMDIWELDKDQLPKALSERNGFSLSLWSNRCRGFSNGGNSVMFNISKSELNKIIKELGRTKEDVYSLIIGTKEYMKDK